MSSTLIDRVTSPILHLVTRPLRVASYGFGVARGIAAAAIRAASGGSGPAHAEWVAPAEPLSEDVVDEHGTPDPRLRHEFPPAAEQRAPAGPGESYATEPSAVSRDSAHGGGGADADIDDWYDQKFLSDEDEPTGVVEALEFGDQFAEPADLKAILNDAETLRRAAELPGDRA